MRIVDLLIRLVGKEYGLAGVQLEPVHQFAFEDRGVYRVDSVTGPSRLLRAYRQDEREDRWLVERAATLLFLEQASYPAPCVIPTTHGNLVGRHAGWAALLLTFIKGTVVSGATDDFYAIGVALGQLHNVDARAAATHSPAVPHARWQPTSTISALLTCLDAIPAQVPPELQGIYTFCLATLRRVEQWPALPMAILHTDCWAQNAIRTPDGAVVLIDWDGAGLGPAILDVGYALVACHAFLPEWPRIVPSMERIAALLDGYCTQRTFTPPERDVLADAIACAEALRTAQWLPEALCGDWRRHRALNRFYARYPVTKEIALIASGHLDALEKSTPPSRPANSAT